MIGQTEDGVALPEFVKRFIQVTCAWDNIDRLEETLCGAGTSHRVNGIIVQARSCGPDPLYDRQDTDQRKGKERTVNFVEAHLPVYNAGT